VSHNLRNHAGNISALLSLIESETSEKEKVQLFEYLNMASTRLNEAIVDLNDIIDQQSGSSKNISRVNISDYFEKIREILSTEIIVHNVKFETDIDDDCSIDYNPAYLESILLNLISNAIKYRHPDRDPVVSVDFKKTGDEPVLTIKDNGQGIDLEEHSESLFGMYKTFHDHEDAKGIGLYITKNQIESMGGSIEVESIVGEGTTFKIGLMCDRSRVEQEAR
jgi:signal transduction histidine kinase